MNQQRIPETPSPFSGRRLRDSLRRLAPANWPRPERSPVIGFLWMCGGWAFLVVAGLGVVLPLVPATPFLLLASYCFYRGSPRMYAWLHRSKQFGPMLDDWEHYRGIRRGLKYRAIALVTVVVLTSLFFSQLPWYGRYAVLALVAVGLSVIWMVPTLPDALPRAPTGDAPILRDPPVH